MSDVDPRVIIEKLFSDEPVTDDEAIRAQLRLGVTPPSWVDAHRLCHGFPTAGPPVAIPNDIYDQLEREGVIRGLGDDHQDGG